MSDWLHSIPVLWMAILVFGLTYLITAGIYAVITAFAVGERARSFKAISPGMLSPLGIIFGLFVVFTAAQVWTDNEKARAEIDREASALRNVAILATIFPRESQVQLRELIRRYITDVAAQEWPMMAQGTANLRAIPGVLAEALQATLALNPSSEGQKTAQRDIATALETALDARRQRILISESEVNLLKWACLLIQAVSALVAIAMVHSDNRLASIIAMGTFATGVAASILLILAHDRPFTGEISIKPDPLLQVMPEISNNNIPHTVRYTEGVESRLTQGHSTLTAFFKASLNNLWKDELEGTRRASSPRPVAIPPVGTGRRAVRARPSWVTMTAPDSRTPGT